MQHFLGPGFLKTVKKTIPVQSFGMEGQKFLVAMQCVDDLKMLYNNLIFRLEPDDAGCKATLDK